MSPVNCPSTVRITKVHKIWRFRRGAFLGSPHEHVETGSHASCRSCPPFTVSRGCRGLKAARGIGTPEARFFWLLPCCATSRPRPVLDRTGIPRASSSNRKFTPVLSSGTSSNQTTALTRWTAVNSTIRVVGNGYLSSAQTWPGSQPTHREMQSNASPIRPRVQVLAPPLCCHGCHA